MICRNLFCTWFLKNNKKQKVEERREKMIHSSSNYLPSKKHMEIMDARFYSSKNSITLIFITVTFYISLMDL